MGATADLVRRQGRGGAARSRVNGEDQGKSGASLETLTLQGQAERPRPPEHPLPNPRHGSRVALSTEHPAPVGQAQPAPLIRSGTWLPLCKQRRHLPGSWGAAACSTWVSAGVPRCPLLAASFQCAAVSTGKAPSRSLRWPARGQLLNGSRRRTGAEASPLHPSRQKRASQCPRPCAPRPAPRSSRSRLPGYWLRTPGFRLARLPASSPWALSLANCLPRGLRPLLCHPQLALRTNDGNRLVPPLGFPGANRLLLRINSSNPALSCGRARAKFIPRCGCSEDCRLCRAPQPPP